MREIIMPMEDKDYDLLMDATRQADPTDEGWTEIVRCKDCKHSTSCVDGYRFCNTFGYKPETFFCAKGERG